MNEVKVERCERKQYIFFEHPGDIWGYKYPDGAMLVFADGAKGKTPAEARAFAAAIISVADAVEREGKG